jgi:hypothetical protein
VSVLSFAISYSKDLAGYLLLISIRSKNLSQKTAVEKTVKAELLKGTPKPEPGEPFKPMTLEEFRKMSLMEKQRFARENPELYQEIYKEE